MGQGEDVGDEPIDGQSGRYLQGKVSNHEWKELEDALGLAHLLLLILRHALVVHLGRQHTHGEGLAQHQHDRHDKEGQRRFPSQLGCRWEGPIAHPPLGQPSHPPKVWWTDRSLQSRDPQKGLVEFPILGQEPNAAVQSQKHRQLRNRQKTTREWILVGIFKQLGRRTILSLLIALELFLDLLHVGLESLGVLCRLGLLYRQRNQNRPCTCVNYKSD